MGCEESFITIRAGIIIGVEQATSYMEKKESRREIEATDSGDAGRKWAKSLVPQSLLSLIGWMSLSQAPSALPQCRAALIIVHAGCCFAGCKRNYKTCSKTHLAQLPSSQSR